MLFWDSARRARATSREVGDGVMWQHHQRAEAEVVSSKIVERFAHLFERPEARLRFLSNTLALHTASKERLDKVLGRLPFIRRTALYQHLVELWLYRLIMQELKKLLPGTGTARLQLLTRHKAPLAARLFFGFYQFRHVFYSLGVVICAFVLFGLYTVIVNATHRVNNYLSHRYQTTVLLNEGGQASGFEQEGAKYLPDYRPEKVWLVEKKESYERYSNGGRILTDYETTNHRRGYTVFRGEQAVSGEELRREPVGIVYHTSEGHLLPFTSDNNASIEARSRGLLEYVQKNRSYNYVIDRFGQIYRIVADDQAANHAGNSVWSKGEDVYVGLNESFLGVSFETTMEAGTLHEQLTEAQILAGRLLTQILRSRYQIDDANCVTHGLVSINPTSMLIAFHHDWARNFPFEAMGLSDKYKVAPSAVKDFGCTYDTETVAKLGGQLWAGVKPGEEEFNRRAAEANARPEEMRRRLSERYRQQMALQLHLRASSNHTSADAETTLAPPHDAEAAKQE